MQEPALPTNETQRLMELYRLNILDTPAEERFDHITRKVSDYFQVPIVLISLVDRNRQWFKSCQGLSVTETDRDISFCGHAILKNDIMVIEDALEDPRFADNPLVLSDPKIRFYAGAPLRATGANQLGTLCLIDTTPRKLSDNDLIMLRGFADMVEQQLVATPSG